MNVLVLAAHPDDEVLGCGGTIARLASEGHRIEIVIFGEGATSRNARREEADASQLDVLRDQARTAGKILGAADVRFHGLPDNRFDTVPLLDIAKAIEAHVERLRPSVVYCQHGGDLNVDHALLYRAAMTATRPLPGSEVRAVYAYPVASSSEWAFQKFEPALRPNVFVDITRTLDAKVRAMEAYAGELREFPHPRSSAGLRASAAHWGSVCGVAAAEPFELVREVR